jgi:hypothetical protein
MYPYLIFATRLLMIWASMTGELVMSITYGIAVKSTNDPYINVAEKGMQGVVEAAIPGSFLVDMIPWLRWIPEWMPGAEFKKKARKWRGYADSMLNDPYEATKRDWVRVYTSHF